jgi:hypothetical protein
MRSRTVENVQLVCNLSEFFLLEYNLFFVRAFLIMHFSFLTRITK